MKQKVNEGEKDVNALIKQMNSALKKDGIMQYLELYEYYHNKVERKRFKAKRRRQLLARLERKKKR